MSEAPPSPAPICPIHREDIRLGFKGIHYGREHWKCPACSFFLDRLPTETPPSHDPHVPSARQPAGETDPANFHDPEI